MRQGKERRRQGGGRTYRWYSSLARALMRDRTRIDLAPRRSRLGLYHPRRTKFITRQLDSLKKRQEKKKEPVKAGTVNNESWNSPILHASPASIALPVNINSFAFVRPIRRGARWVPPAPGMMPSLHSGRPSLVTEGPEGWVSRSKGEVMRRGSDFVSTRRRNEPRVRCSVRRSGEKRETRETRLTDDSEVTGKGKLEPAP